MADNADNAGNRLHQVYALGQSIWYDNIRRGLITSGELQRLIDQDAIVGVTSNPTIFEKAIDGGEEYDEQMRQLVAEGVTDPLQIFEALAVQDIQMAADVLRPIYDRTNGGDGFISLEVSPLAANDTQKTIAEARHLFQRANRPNVMIKIPATAEGIPAIEQMIYEGVNINITLIFALEAYQQVMEAYIRGLEHRLAEGQPVTGIASVASFFVSRVDTLVDKLLDQKIAQTGDQQQQEQLKGLRGKAAIANARLAYQQFLQVFHGDRFANLKEHGAEIQRPLWASTSTKNPAYRDVLYVEELIGPETVDTMPPQTITAFQEHGVAEVTVTRDIPQQEEYIRQIEAAGISMADVTKQLELEGVKSFADSFNKLIQSTKEKAERLTQQPVGGNPMPSGDQVLAGHEDLGTSQHGIQDASAGNGHQPEQNETVSGSSSESAASVTSEGAAQLAMAGVTTGTAAATAGATTASEQASTPTSAVAEPAAGTTEDTTSVGTTTAAAASAPPDRQTAHLGVARSSVDQTLQRASADSWAEKVWSKDPALWKPNPAEQNEITDRLGWLTVMREMRDALPRLHDLVADVKAAGFKYVVLCGMGGSSLAPEVLRRTFGVAEGHPDLLVLDSTDPATILATEHAIDLAKTLFIISSKSGGTIETMSHYKLFAAKLREMTDNPGAHFIAITDPGTKLEALADQEHFRATFRNPPDIGGRYSALSFFGLVPAALIGIDVAKLLNDADAMAARCQPNVPAERNPGLVLGSILGTLATKGRNKATIIVSPAISTFGYWLEQLLAESTGKEGKGILPVEGEALGAPDVYGDDRVFAYLRTEEGADPRQDDGITRLEQAGQPVIRIALADKYALAAEFFRWEFATAIAGAVLGINAFDQPNVQESKDNTDRLLKDYERTKVLPQPKAVLVTESRHVALVASGELGVRLRESISLQDALETVAHESHPGDYFALLAYVEPTQQVQRALERIRIRLRDTRKTATTLGYGPRFQHSTGQEHKGGPNTGIFLQFVAQDKEDVAIPNEPYTFGTLKAAQALGDLQSLEAHGRRVVRIDLNADIAAGLQEVIEALEAGQMS